MKIIKARVHYSSSHPCIKYIKPLNFPPQDKIRNTRALGTSLCINVAERWHRAGIPGHSSFAAAHVGMSMNRVARPSRVRNFRISQYNWSDRLAAGLTRAWRILLEHLHTLHYHSLPLYFLLTFLSSSLHYYSPTTTPTPTTTLIPFLLLSFPAVNPNMYRKK